MKSYRLLFLMFIFLVGCMDLPQNITVPQWDIDLNLPLTNRHYTLDELIQTDEYISIDSLNDFVYIVRHNDIANKSTVEEFIAGKLDQENTGIEIPIVNGEGTIGVPYSNGMALDSAKFIQGTLTISITNNSSSDINVTMTLPAFINPSGAALNIEATVTGGATENVQRDLSDYSYDASKQTFQSDTLQIDGSIEGEDFTENLVIGYTIENTLFSYIAGIIPSTSIEPIKSEVELPVTDDVKDFRDRITFHSAELTLLGNYYDMLLETDPNNPFDLLIDTLYVYALREGETVPFFLKLNGKDDNNLGPLTISNGVLNEVYDENNSNISAFLSYLPENIIIYAAAVVNPDSKRGAATNEDYIQFGFDLMIKSIISIDNLEVTDSIDFEMDEDARSNIQDFRAATINFKIDNNIAFGGEVIIDFADSNYNSLFTMDTINFEPALVDEDGIPSQWLSESIVELDSTEVYQLSESYFVIMKLIINTRDSDSNQKAALTSKDWIDIISFCKIKYHLDN